MNIHCTCRLKKESKKNFAKLESFLFSIDLKNQSFKLYSNLFYISQWLANSFLVWFFCILLLLVKNKFFTLLTITTQAFLIHQTFEVFALLKLQSVLISDVKRSFASTNRWLLNREMFSYSSGETFFLQFCLMQFKSFPIDMLAAFHLQRLGVT